MKSLNKEVPVTYQGVMVGVAELEVTGEGENVVHVRLNHDSLFKPFFIDHTMNSISITDEQLGPDEFDPDRLCNSCDLIYGHAGPCTPYFTPGL